MTLDTTGPTITINSPPNGGAYVLESVPPPTAVYTCSDPSGVVVCRGPVPSGGTTPTDAVGAHPFTVDAVDGAGNPSSRTHTYHVVYRVLAQFDASRPWAIGPGKSVPVALQITTASGVNRSSAAITLTETRLVKTGTGAKGTVQSSSTPPDPDPVFDVDGTTYRHALDTGRLTAGTWRLYVSVSDDPDWDYYVEFTAK